MDVIQDTYKSSQDDRPASSFLSNSQRKSFESIVKTPYQSPYTNGGVDRSRSIESPYTSLGSGRSSYASIKPTSYRSLKAKAEKASSLHESKSKAVMQALKNLQDKIGTLEVDRVKAENNMKSLASETKEYKELLNMKRAVTPGNNSNSTTHRRHSHSDVLENQLENAQGRCEMLEKQLEYMRKMMQGQKSPYPTSPRSEKSSNDTPVSLSSNDTPVPLSSSPSYSVTSPNQLKSTPQAVMTSDSRPVEIPSLTVEESPALEKLNDLEREHLKLTASQNHTEIKIRELEEKIREESHCRKLLEDKATELQQAVAMTTNSTRIPKPSPVPTLQLENVKQARRNKQKKKKTTKRMNQRYSSGSTATTPHSMIRQTSKPLSPMHYHLDLANIPFVVGQSTTPSHSVGANVQNVLSIMKAHSKLCCYGDLPKTSQVKVKTSSSRSNAELRDLLSTLNEEFQQLSGEHRVLVTRIQEDRPPVVLKNLERDLEQIVEKMEIKGKQINTIRDLLKFTPVESARTPVMSARLSNGVNNRINIGSEEVEVVTTVRSARRKSADIRVNKNLEFFKNVKKLQCTLQRDDLKWE